MKLARLRHRHWRLRFAWVALLALLFQQSALAMYVCPDLETPPQPVITMSGCDSMAAPDPEAPALCDQHCRQDHIATADAKTPQVPPLALPPLQFARTEALLPPVRARHYQDVPVCRSDPPPTQRFCSLLI